MHKCLRKRGGSLGWVLVPALLLSGANEVGHAQEVYLPGPYAATSPPPATLLPASHPGPSQPQYVLPLPAYPNAHAPCPAPWVPSPSITPQSPPTGQSPSTSPSTQTPQTPQSPDTSAPGQTTPSTPSPTDSGQGTQGNNFASAPQAGTEGGNSFAPNMLGDLLQSYRGVQFSYLQAGDFTVANTSGTVNFRNTKVAENNSAIPRDRASLRYNYFDNALSINGLAATPQLGNTLTQTQFGQAIRFNQVAPASRIYDSHLYTLQLEKTFLGGAASVEFRLPFATTLRSNLDLSAGRADFFPDTTSVLPLVAPTPAQTLGGYDTELQDSQLIFKAILYTDARNRWYFSGGLATSIPTGNDLNVRVVDYSNRVPGDPILPNGAPGNLSYTQIPVNNVTQPFAYEQRTRTFHIQNETWGLSPFLALAATPTGRSFINAFAQVDLPVNKSRYSYRERDVDLQVQTEGTNGLNPVVYDRTLTGKINDQYVLHLDVGGGYWLYQDREADLLNGLAGLLELHYTTSLTNNLVTLPAFRKRTILGDDGTGAPLLTAPDPFPAVGNTRGRFETLDVTLGTTFLLANQVTLAPAFSFPLLQGNSRSFDWEFQVQLNWYWGGTGRGFVPPSS